MKYSKFKNLYCPTSVDTQYLHDFEDMIGTVSPKFKKQLGKRYNETIVKGRRKYIDLYSKYPQSRN